MRLARLAGLFLSALVSACATPSVVHRGAAPQQIHSAAVAVVEGEGYRCEASPDLSWRTCSHPERTDFAFAYLPASNMLQVWSSFSRDDEGLVTRWRTGACEPLGTDIGAINSETIVKIVCDNASFRFEMSTWVPEKGLTETDLRAFFGIFRDVISETIQQRGFLPSEANTNEASPSTGPTGGSTT
jgi:hypothetical protein